MADEEMDFGGDPTGHQAGAGQVADQESEICPEDLEAEVLDNEGMSLGRRFKVVKGPRRDEDEVAVAFQPESIEKSDWPTLAVMVPAN
jgi:hypothetical protein